MNRRQLFGQAAAAGAVGVPVIGTTTARHAALAQPTTGRMKRDIEGFERRVELIRQSLDIPGMSVAVLRQQAVIFARGFGVVDLTNDTKATENTPFPRRSFVTSWPAICTSQTYRGARMDHNLRSRAQQPRG
jgi:CubicO group peptidase (beta-lactamase class C family)